MANRRFEMFEYRQVIHRMRMGQSDRAIAKTKLMGRLKCAAIRSVAEERGWLEAVPLPDDNELARVFDTARDPNPIRESLSLSYQEQIKKWVGEGLWVTTIHRALVEQFGFNGNRDCCHEASPDWRPGRNPGSEVPKWNQCQSALKIDPP